MNVGLACDSVKWWAFVLVVFVPKTRKSKYGQSHFKFRIGTRHTQSLINKGHIFFLSVTNTPLY
jgi:hypothetical protein